MLSEYMESVKIFGIVTANLIQIIDVRATTMFCPDFDGTRFVMYETSEEN